MNGVAYRTPMRPTVFTTVDDNAAVYAVHPPAVYQDTESTSFVIVAWSQAAGDTVIYPCDDRGQMLSFSLIACVVTKVHRVALLMAGYTLEAVRPRVDA